MSEEKEPDEWKSIKIKEKVYESLKKMGKGISGAVEILVKDQQEKIERKIEDVKEISNELAAIMLEQGIFDIRFKGAGVSDVIEDGDTITVRGFINVLIPNQEARQRIIEVLKGEKEEVENK